MHTTMSEFTQFVKVVLKSRAKHTYKDMYPRETYLMNDIPEFGFERTL